MTATVRHIVTDMGPPTSPPPGIGAHYIDTQNRTQYLAYGTTSASDWVLIDNQQLPQEGNVGDLLTLTETGAAWVTVTPPNPIQSTVNVVLM